MTDAVARVLLGLVSVLVITIRPKIVGGDARKSRPLAFVSLPRGISAGGCYTFYNHCASEAGTCIFMGVTEHHPVMFLETLLSHPIRVPR